MRRVITALGALSVLSLLALPAAAQEPLSATGSVTGDVRVGSTLNVDVRITHTGGWPQIQDMTIALDLRGRPLDEVVIDFQESSIAIEGGRASVPIGDPGEERGSFFKIEPSKVSLAAQGNEMHVTIPIGLISDPATGSRVTYAVTGVAGESIPARALTAPAERNQGLTWGTVSVAMLFALFIGAYLGNIVGGSRKRRRGPSVYATVQRRLDQERAAR